jgi:hypothetical protein
LKACLFNHFQHAVNILQDIIVPKPQYLETFSLQPCISFIIFSFFEGMPSAVHLYDDSSLKTYKINDISPNGLLSPKF